jgi:tetratricopeptide (TPR) repeat protein
VLTLQPVQDEVPRDRVPAMVEQADRLLSAREFARAAELLEQAAELDPTAAAPRLRLATAYQELGRAEDALQALLAAAELSSSPAAYHRLAVLLTERGKLEAAVSALQSAASLGYADPFLWWTRTSSRCPRRAVPRAGQDEARSRGRSRRARRQEPRARGERARHDGERAAARGRFGDAAWLFRSSSRSSRSTRSAPATRPSSSTSAPRSGRPEGLPEPEERRAAGVLEVPAQRRAQPDGARSGRVKKK